MNASTTVQGIQAFQGAWSILTALQMTAYLWQPYPPKPEVQGQLKYGNDLHQSKLAQAKPKLVTGLILLTKCIINPPDGASFDFIIVGAGSAGSVIANRLTEIEDVTVLLIEAGGDPPLESVTPGLFPLLKNTSVDWKYETEDDGFTQQLRKNHGVTLTRGKMLGGSSSLNFMVYTRGSHHDYSTWAKITGDDSWNWEKVIPYFKKSEKLVDPILRDADAGAFHGTNGYLGTSRNYNEEVLEYFEAFKELGHDIVLDINGNHSLGYTESMFTIAHGKRQSTALAFLNPIINRRNLYILKNTLVSKILFDNDKNAIGVEAILEDNTTVSFKAKKEVIVSGGSISSPQLLMLSGIGPKDHLESQNIEVLSDLPVGQALQEHAMAFIAQTLGQSPPSKPVNPDNFPHPFIVGLASLNKSQDYPDYQTFNFVLNEPSGILQFCEYFGHIDEICDDLYDGSIGKEVLFTAVYLLHPKSRGKILLRSKDPRDKPIVHAGLYSDRTDIDTHVRCMLDFLELQRTSYFQSVQSTVVIPETCGCGKNNGTLEFWRCYAICMTGPGFHYAASCPMGSVVDSRLKVFGVQKLRVSDVSTMPQITGSNTNADTIMIGERTADFIKQDYNL